MIPVDEALQIVLSVAQKLPPVTVPLHQALGKVLAQDIVAPDPLPPYPASIKDGYAVIASDGPGEYRVIVESRAGNDGLGVTVTPGTVAYVTTGGPIPDGADAVVQVEDTEQVKAPSETKHVKILVQTGKGVDIRQVGCDIQKDAVVLKSGERLGASEVGLLATVGVTMVKVQPIPTIAVLSTGDELVGPTIGSLSRGKVLPEAPPFLKTDPVRPEFYRATIRWEANDGSGSAGFVAESTGHQMSSRLLSMKSANALELCLVIIRKETFLLNEEKV